MQRYGVFAYLFVFIIVSVAGCNSTTIETTMNTNTASIDPSLEVARLLTPERQSAYERLREWWFENQPDAPILSGSEIGHVEKYDVDDETIYVIFSGANGKHEGGICLVDSTGKINPIFQGNNYLTEEDRFMDVNGDGIPEIISVTTMGGKHESNPNRIVTNTTNIDIIPVNRVQKPLLRILFDKRKFRESSKWRWELDNSSNATVIRLFRISESNPIVHFEWNSQIGEFNCPNGSLSDGFIARPGQIPLDLIEDFIRPIESAE